MTAEFRTFWGALLSVLLKCLAGLGIAPAARAAARRQAVAAAVPAATYAAPTAACAAAPAGTGVVTAPPAEARTVIPALPAQKAGPSPRAGRRTAPGGSGTASAPAAPSVPGARRRTDVHVPAPRNGASRAFRRMAGRTLPPTMKQRIRAEAHGATPSSRTLPACMDAADLAGLTALAGCAVTGGGRTRAELALCA
jgi:hypothetical protein